MSKEMPLPYENEMFPEGYRDEQGSLWTGRTARSLQPFNESLAKAYKPCFGSLVTSMGISYITEDNEKGKVNKATLKVWAKPNLSRQELEFLINSIPEEIPTDVPIKFEFKEDQIVAASTKDKTVQTATKIRNIIHYRKAA